MAREFEDLGFRLPSEFLTDDDLLTDFKSESLKATRFEDFCYGKSFGFNSDLGLPTEMMVSCRAENESEEDDLVAELTRKLSLSTLRNPSFSSHYASKDWKSSCGCKFCSTGSPDSVSGACSPPDVDDYLRREYLYAAAEEVARMRLIEKTAAFYSSKLLLPPAKPGPRLYADFYPIQARSQSRISAQLLLAAKQEQMMKKVVYGSGVSEFQLEKGRSQGLSMAAWSGLQQPVPKKERTGTGVFLPKRFGSIPAVTRKKSGSPTVLLPEKVVHALNLNVESMDAHLHRCINSATSPFDYDAAVAAAAALKQRNNVMMMAAQQRRNHGVSPAMNQHPSLPQDWTY